MSIAEGGIFMEMILVSVVAVYLSMAIYFFISWLRLLNQDSSPSQEEHICIVDILMATILWPLVVPIIDTFLD
jgi:hypothetical protein